MHALFPSVAGPAPSSFFMLIQPFLNLSVHSLPLHYDTTLFHYHTEILLCIAAPSALCWPLVPKFAGSNPAKAVGFLGQKKSSAHLPSFGGEVKPLVPYHRFAACKRSLNLCASRNLGKITGQFLAHNSTFRC